MIVDSVVNHFQSQVKKDRTWRPTWANQSLPKLSDAMTQQLDAPFSWEEIRLTMFSTDGNKSPGLDWFGLSFYQR
ncbi:hypothetical protein QJS10_CPB12g00783 [Acorus calamus]|uniref:Uncharacterized protein n=1 Tax=Acorus calamus TaxID=4465 RepID=A0AAV9DP54_ACOCL|nr:hypothetical protein QJS10_CPB12g00783 [Acorus calamus]